MIAELIEAIQANLTNDLLKPGQGGARPFAGHCYVACEALMHAAGYHGVKLVPQTVRHEGGVHWYLRDAEGNVLDPTADQFESPVPYGTGRGRGFLTKAPSKRARTLLERIGVDV
jgi:hypothetical protein